MMRAKIWPIYLSTTALTAPNSHKRRVTGHASTVTVLSLATSLLGVSPATAACTVTSQSNYICEGTETSAQAVDEDNAVISTTPDYSVDTPVGAALEITGNGALRYTDFPGVTLSSDDTAGLVATAIAFSTAGAFAHADGSKNYDLTILEADVVATFGAILQHLLGLGRCDTQFAELQYR